MSVWSTYYQLAARLTRRIKDSFNPVVIWGGKHMQLRPEDGLDHADLVCPGEGEYVLAELTDRLSAGQDFTDIRGCWVNSGGKTIRNPSRPLIADLDLLPLSDTTPDNKYYLGYNAWRDVAGWDEQAVSYEALACRGCPFECTFCIHNFARSASKGLGTYIRRRSVGHLMAELRIALQAHRNLRAVSFSDDIFAPPMPWLEEFCAAYKKEIGLPFVAHSFPGMVEEKRVRLMRDAGLWCTTMGIQSGSERIRRECYGRDTSTDAIVTASKLWKRHGVVRNFDFITDNPYETGADRLATADMLCQLPKPFYFNCFSLTFFPGVELTARALRDGLIGPNDVEHVAQKGYHAWGGVLAQTRSDEQLYWDVIYAMAVHGAPPWLIGIAKRSAFFRKHIRQGARVMRRVRAMAIVKARVIDRIMGRPNLWRQYFLNTNRRETPVRP